ncbi:hypothetical protein FRC04_008321 [Tulasnella sp. 424]|nr:hypothetical protein FRC04_008321 [Tulasnella sp. 424]
MPPTTNGDTVIPTQFIQVGPPSSRNQPLNPTDVLPELEGKDLQEQLELIANRLEVESRIRDGADKILMARIAIETNGRENLRRQVEAQLSNAKAQITALTTVMEQIRGSPTNTRPRKKATGLVTGKRGIFAAQASQGSSKNREEHLDRDDFKTTLSQARSLIQTLATYRTLYPGNPTPSPMTATSSNISYGSEFSGGGTSSGTSVPMMNERDMDRSRTGIMTSLVAILQRSLRVCYELDIVEVVRAIMPGLADYASKESRAATYRLIRHLLLDAESVDRLQPFGLDWYIVRSLARDNKHAVEKEQAIKLIRSYIDVGSSRRSPTVGAGSGHVPLSEGVMRALIAVAEHPEDQFRHIALETLAEILLIDVELVARTEGIRVLLQALADGPHEISPILANAFLYLVDSPRTRVYLKPGIDLEIALTGLTDAYGKGTGHAEQMRASSRVVATMLRSWSGLMYLCMDNMRAIASIINTLRIPSLETREVILDLFFEVLKIDTPDWYKAFIDGRRLTVIGPRGVTAIRRNLEPPDGTYNTDKLNISHQYIALLLLVFLEAGLLDALVGILESEDPTANLTRKVTLLLGELLRIANRILPSSMAAEVQSLPSLFALASDSQNIGNSRKVAAAALSSIDSFNRNHARLQRPKTEGNRQRANSIEDTMRRNQRQVEQAKIKLSMQIDDKSFQETLMKTQVMVNKDATKWDLDIIMSLIEGPLLNPKRVEEAFRVLKWGKRLISFFHPLANRFSGMKKSVFNFRYIHMGCALLTTLVSCPEGVKFLREEDPLLKQIADCLNQLDPVCLMILRYSSDGLLTCKEQFNPGQVADPLFSAEKIATTLTYGYIEMLGTLSKHADGIEFVPDFFVLPEWSLTCLYSLMEKAKIFTTFYHISELKSREDLIKAIIENIDYTSGGHARIVLSKALTSSYMDIRFFATTHLGQLIRSTSKANEWTLRLLLTQLYDPALEVRELAVQFLEEACESMDVLELVVQMQPTLDHLGEIGHPLLLKFMSTTIGFRFLYKSGYIDREMDGWFHERNYQYVLQVEVYLAQVFSSNPQDEDNENMRGTVPPHFYGEIAKTELGCQVLSDKGHFAEFAHVIRQHGMESDDLDLIVKLKSVLWAVGNIGAAPGGLPFLEEEGIIPNILDIAETSQVLSVRGTAFFVLGLISSTTQGAELLEEFEWEATLTPLGETTGLCVPLDVGNFVQISHWPSAPELREPRWIQPTDDSMELQILTAISNLQNTVIANEAARSLTRFKAQHRRIFSSITLFYRVLHILSTQRYRLPVRRYILDLFDIDLDPDVMNALYNLSATFHHRPESPTASVSPSRRKGHSRRVEENVGLGIRLAAAESSQTTNGRAVDGGTQQQTSQAKQSRRVNGEHHHVAGSSTHAKHSRPAASAQKNGMIALNPVKRVEGFGVEESPVVSE